MDNHPQLNSAYGLNVKIHNEQISENRYVLSKIVDCIKFCGAFELALRGHDESADSNNPGVFKVLPNFSAKLEASLRDYIFCWLFNNAVSTTELFSIDRIGDREMVFGEIKPKIHYRLPDIRIRFREKSKSVN